ncbi:MAG: UvrB/UvrC motif-containing protein [Bacteroidia bacterium]|nr:UvrB/UvrC motif-containing protein [Bacteroidia bacterium]
MKFNIKNSLLLIIFSISFSTYYAQMYSEPQKTEVKKEKPKKAVAPVDTSGKKYLGIGLIVNGTAGLSYGISKGNYNYDIYKTNYSPYSARSEDYDRYTYSLKHAIGYRLGFGVGFQSRSFGVEIPVMFCVDRFKVPDISSKNRLKIRSLELGLNENWRFAKEKAFILFGQYFAYNWLFKGEHSIGLNFGAGYVFLKKFNVSLRYKFNLFSIDRNESGVVRFEDYPDKDESFTIGNVRSAYNSLLLVLHYDLVNTRKMKYVKKKQPKVKKPADDYEYLNQQNISTPTPTKPAIDYSGYSDSDLNLALKEANSKSDLDAMLGIQKELDKRKQADEFSKFSYVQLEQELNKALDKEDYKRADMIKKEMAKRDTQKGMPSENKGDSLESKSIEELQKLKDEAVQKEDYDKAKLIQDIINKKKP